MPGAGGGSWFAELFGFEEGDYEETKAGFGIEADEDGQELLVATAADGRRFRPGRFERPQLAELRARLAAVTAGEGSASSSSLPPPFPPRSAASPPAAAPPPALAAPPAAAPASIEVRNVFGDVREMHVQPDAAGAVFQVASQFNCLEFIDASRTPENGVACYEFDHTQGPACALACAASTVWRNYFAPFDDGERGQRAGRQFNNLADVQALLGAELLEVRNGYTFCSDVPALAAKVDALNDAERDALRAALRVGVQWDAEVTDRRMEYKKSPEGKWANIGIPCEPVTQVFCSALSLGSSPQLRKWRAFATIVLEAAYEATLAVAALNLHRGGPRDVYLTLLGGGNFGNGPKWIEGAIRRALEIHRGSGLRVHIVHFSKAAPWVRAYVQLVADFGDGAAASVAALGASDDEEEDW